MSLMGTLAKVAIGVAVAKGASSLMSKGGSAQAASGGGLQDMLGGMMGGQSSSQSGGGLGGMLEGLQQQNPGTRDGGIDDLLGSLGGQGGGLSSLVQGLSGGSGGGLAGMLGGLGGAAATSKASGFGDLLNQAMQRKGEPEAQPTPEQDAVAGLMLRALIQAAMSDGKIDADERQKLMDRLGDVSPEERAFVQAEMQKPVDAQALASDVPPGLEQQTYTMALMGIDLDNRNEAQFLDGLAGALGLDHGTVNAIHAQMGAPAPYR